MGDVDDSDWELADESDWEAAVEVGFFVFFDVCVGFCGVFRGVFCKVWGTGLGTESKCIESQEVTGSTLYEKSQNSESIFSR